MTEKFELLTVIPPRADGTVIVDVPLGRGKFHTYTFAGEPPACLVDPEHVDYLQGLGTFMDRQAYEDEQELMARVNQRKKASPAFAQSLKAQTFDPAAAATTTQADDADDEAAVDMNAAPVEAGSKPTGRVRKSNSSAGK